MKTFMDFAQSAQDELNAEKKAIEAEKEKLAKKASLLAARETKIEDEENVLSLKAKELQLREEKVSMREGIIGREDKAAQDLKKSEENNKSSMLSLKKAQELNDDATQKLAELSKRELALSEREKSYKQEIEMDVMRRFAFGK